MKKISQWLCLGLLAFIDLTHANALLTAQAPEVNVTQIEFLRWVEKDLFLNMTFSVKNDNDSDFRIKAVRYDMSIMGRTVAEDYRDQKIELKAHTVTSVTMPIKVDMIRFFSAVPDALLMNQLDYLLTGAVVVEDLILHIPFERKGTIPLFSQP